MEILYAVRDDTVLAKYQDFVRRNENRLQEYLSFLEKTYAVNQLPRALVLTDAETATHLLSDIPVPAYTNDYRTVFCPELESWTSIYLRQLDTLPESASVRQVRQYYETQLSESNVLQILGHEFVHHSDLFPEGDYENGIWFEEGMCEYISRRFFLSEDAFAKESEINEMLVSLLWDIHGGESLEAFGADTYDGSYAAIFFSYWRSFLAVKVLVEKHSGDVMAVFLDYHAWLDSGRQIPLSQWFALK